KAEALRRHAEHAAELAAAQHAEPGAGHQGKRGLIHLHRRAGGRKFVRHRAQPPGGSAMARAAALWRSRKASRRAAKASSVPASIATAYRPALAAPASPMAKVATGMPRGIWTIDSSESSPRRYFEGTGTPSTGTVVLAASMPGRCAAPPAPAMIARRPRARAPAAYSNMSSGIRCADTTFASCGTSNSRSTATACCMTSQSLLEPITTPIRGAAMSVLQFDAGEPAQRLAVLLGGARNDLG